MREIKFRYWCKIESKMYDKAYIEEHSKYAMMSEILEVAQQRYIFMQYTGLKDKNGKEIYEGDIVQFTSYERVDTTGNYKNSYGVYKDIEIIGVVKIGEFKENIMFYIESAQTVSYESYFFADSKNRSPRFRNENLSKPLLLKKEYEVIGNIYQNPKLLEGTTP